MTDSDSPWHAWKWVSSLFMTALLWECIIASIYWPILYPEDRKQRLIGDTRAQIGNVFDHAVPIILLWVDWALNRIWIEWRQIYPNLLVILFYGIVNIIVTFASGTPVYPPLSWDSFWSWLMGFSILLLAFGYWAGIYYLTRYKFKKMGMHDTIPYAATIYDDTLIPESLLV